MSYLFTSESVSEGHPDKVADQISDALLDTMLEQDQASRVAIETLVTTGLVMISGEVTTNARFDLQDVVRGVIRDIGYTNSDLNFEADSVAVLSSLHSQSADIAQGVNENDGLHAEQGAGDQGMMFGYACDETPELMPLAISCANGLVRTLADIRKNSDLMSYLRPDAKSQVTVQYEQGDDGRMIPSRIHTVVVSTQHDEGVDRTQIEKDVREHVLPRVFPAGMLDGGLILHVNPTGRFVDGGPHGDTGLTGRKIIVDTYGGKGAHGGGAFSGKDPSKVDRSAAYAVRHVAKNIVAAELAKEVLVQVAYAIGVADPVSIYVDTYGTGTVPDSQLTAIVRDVFDLRPKVIIERLGLLQPIYRKTAAYGHFGRSEFSWEALDHVEELARAASIMA